MKNWKKWLLAAGITLLPAVAFAATHVGRTDCGCPICSLMR